MQTAKTRVTNDEIVERLLRADHFPEELNHHLIEGAWFDLKEARGWRPQWNARDGLLANGLSKESLRIDRICVLYEQAFRRKHAYDQEIRQELETAETHELAAIHNVYTMGRSCLRLGDTKRADLVLQIADEILDSRGIPVEFGKLLKKLGRR